MKFDCCFLSTVDAMVHQTEPVGGWLVMQETASNFFNFLGPTKLPEFETLCVIWQLLNSK